MTQEIIEMAEKCGLPEFENNESQAENLIEFAKLIAERERNRLADELQKMPLNDTANSIAIWIRGQE